MKWKFSDGDHNAHDYNAYNNHSGNDVYDDYYHEDHSYDCRSRHNIYFVRDHCCAHEDNWETTSDEHGSRHRVEHQHREAASVVGHRH